MSEYSKLVNFDIDTITKGIISKKNITTLKSNEKRSLKASSTEINTSLYKDLGVSYGLMANRFRNNRINAERAYSNYKRTSLYRLNKLSTNILSDLLQDTKYNLLFPFKKGKDSNVNIYNDSHKDGQITIPNGKEYRITSSKIPDLNIYLNRIKQKYKGSIEFGECIDLVVGSTIKNEIYRKKHEHYIISKKGGFTLQELYDELLYIKEHSETDKGTKRKIRMDFLQHMLESPYKDIYELILKACYEEIMPHIETSQYNGSSPLIPNKSIKKRKINGSTKNLLDKNYNI
jgi:hypothetical protein